MHLIDAKPNDLILINWPGYRTSRHLTRYLTDKLAQGHDLADLGRRGPIDCDHKIVLGMALWDAADKVALVDRQSASVPYHLIGWLPTNATREAWRERDVLPVFFPSMLSESFPALFNPAGEALGHEEDEAHRERRHRSATRARHAPLLIRECDIQCDLLRFQMTRGGFGLFESSSHRTDSLNYYDEMFPGI